MLYLATACVVPERALAQYARRWGAECLHQALKGRGLHLEDTHLVHPERLCVLLIVLSVALVWCCLTGEMHAEDVEIKILKHGRPEKSLFRHGLDAPFRKRSSTSETAPWSASLRYLPVVSPGKPAPSSVETRFDPYSATP